MKIKLLIADDHNVVRHGLKTFLALDPEIEIVGMARNGVEALKMARELKPEVMLLDLLMPEMDGYDVLEALRRELPAIKVLVLTSVLEEAAISRALRAGAAGYLLKDLQARDLCLTIKSLATGQIMLSPYAAKMLANRMGSSATPEILSNREVQILKMLAEGKANKVIARQLGLSEGTVKTHVSILLSKLGLQSRTQAAIYAAQTGLISTESADYA